MSINFRQPQSINAIRFSSTLVWTVASNIITEISGTSPLALVNSLAKPLRSLVQYGKCVSSGGTLYCNNGVLRYDWHDIITTSQLNGYGTYVSPISAATTRAYRRFKDLPNGTYQFAVDGDYEIIVQWRDPADSADGMAQYYENLSGWMTSGEVTLDKSTGGYGVAVRRTSGTDSITPSNFDGVIHVQEQEFYVDGTPEVLTISATGETAQTVSDIPDLFATLDGTVYDEVDLVSGVLTRRTEPVYENGAVVIKALATPTTEQTTSHSLHSYTGGTAVSWLATVSGTEKTVEFAQGETASNTVGTAKVGTAQAA